MDIIKIENKNNRVGAICRIETIYDYVELLLNVCEYMILHNQEIQAYYSYTPNYNDVIVYDNRLFVFYNKAKYVSIHFPFRISIGGEMYYVNCGQALSQANISHIRKALYYIKNHNNYIIDGIADCNTGLNDTDEEYVTIQEFNILRQLLKDEPAYIRYDWDKKNENGSYHPEIHFDINFSKSGSFKIGLNELFSPKRFFELFKDSVPCEYIESGALHNSDKKYLISKVIKLLQEKIQSNSTD